MPELPEVETTCRGISAHIINSVITQLTIRNPRLRWPIPSDLSEHIVQQQVLSVHRRAKYLLLKFPKGTLIIHLGMSGSLRIVDPQQAYDKHDHVEICFANGNALRLKDPRRFGAVLWTNDAIEHHPLLNHLGPEPLSSDFNAAYLYQQSKNKQVVIKTFLMNSKVVVGVGNIYATEILFACGVHPKRAAGRISLQRYQLIYEATVRILQEAVAQGGTTLKDFVGGTGKPGYFKQELLAYGRQGLPCVQCEKILTEIRQANRSTVYCTHCQN